MMTAIYVLISCARHAAGGSDDVVDPTTTDGVDSGTLPTVPTSDTLVPDASGYWRILGCGQSPGEMFVEAWYALEAPPTGTAGLGSATLRMECPTCAVPVEEHLPTYITNDQAIWNFETVATPDAFVPGQTSTAPCWGFTDPPISMLVVVSGTSVAGEADCILVAQQWPGWEEVAADLQCSIAYSRDGAVP